MLKSKKSVVKEVCYVKEIEPEMIKLMSNTIALDVKMILAWSQTIFLNHVDKSEKCKKITLTFVKLKNLIFDKKCLTLTGFMYIFQI